VTPRTIPRTEAGRARTAIISPEESTFPLEIELYIKPPDGTRSSPVGVHYVSPERYLLDSALRRLVGEIEDARAERLRVHQL
jgi:hypothetical protein